MQIMLPRSYWVRLLGVALLVRCLDVFVAFGSMPFISDASAYHRAAVALMANFPGSEAYYWPPGQPYFMAGLYTLFGVSPLPIQLATIVLNVLSVVAVLLLAQQLLKDQRSVKRTGWIAALYPPSIIMSGQPFSQSLAGLALLLAIYYIWRGWQEKRIGFFIIAGVALGIGILTRSSMLSFAPVLLVFWIIALRRARIAKEGFTPILVGPLLGAAAVTAIILPFFLFSVNHGAGWNLSTNNESNFFVGNCPYTHFYKTNQLAVRDLRYIDSAPGAYVMYYRDLPNSREAMMKAAVEYMADHPFITLNRTFSRIRAFWGFDYALSREVQKFYGFSNTGLALLVVFEGGGYILMMALSLCGLFLASKTIAPSATRFVLWGVIAYQLPYMFSYAMGYYHYPAAWLLMPFAGAGLAHITPWRRETWREIRSHRWLLVALVILILVQAEYAFWALMMM